MTTPVPQRSVILVSVHAYPDPAVGARRISEFARHLASRGVRVRVIAEQADFALSGGELPAQVVRHGIEHRLPVSAVIVRFLRRLRWGNHARTRAPEELQDGSAQAANQTLIDRLKFHYHRYTVCVDNYKLWSMKCGMLLFKLMGHERPDAVFISGPPFSPFAIAALVCRWKGVPLIADFRDPWLKSPDGDSLEYRGFRRNVDTLLERFTIARSAGVATTSQRFCDQLRARYPQSAGKVRMIRNGFDAGMELPPPRRDGQLVLLFAGTIYLDRNPMPLFEALRRMRDSGDIDPARIRLRMVGECELWRGGNLRLWVLENDMSGIISIEPPVSASEVRALTASAHVLVNFAQNQRDAVPAKLFEQIAARRQVLLFAEPDSESSIASQESSLVLRLDSDIDGVERVMRQLYSQWVQGEGGAQMVEPDISEFSRTVTNQMLEEMLPAAK